MPRRRRRRRRQCYDAMKFSSPLCFLAGGNGRSSRGNIWHIKETVFSVSPPHISHKQINHNGVMMSTVPALCRTAQDRAGKSLSEAGFRNITVLCLYVSSASRLLAVTKEAPCVLARAVHLYVI